MKSDKVLIGILAGFAAGAVVGMLFSPDKGSAIRKKVSGKGNEFLEGIKSRFEDFLVSATNELEYAKGEATSLVDTGKAKVEEIKGEIKNLSSPKNNL